MTQLLEEVQNEISTSAAHDPRELIRRNRVLKKKVEELKSLLEESLNGLDSKSDTNLRSLKSKSIRLKKEKNQLVRDIKAINEATANSSLKGEERKEELEAKLVRAATVSSMMAYELRCPYFCVATYVLSILPKLFRQFCENLEPLLKVKRIPRNSKRHSRSAVTIF